MDLCEFPLRNGGELTESISLISVGRNHWKKGYPDGLLALARLQKYTQNFHYTIVGGDLEEIRYMTYDLELTDKITCVPPLSIEEVNILLQHSAIQIT